MNPQLLLLTLCQGLFLTNNVTFMAINGLVGLALAPVPWMATLPLCAYVAGGAFFAPIVARHQTRFGRQRGFQIALIVAMLSCALAGWSAANHQFWGVVAATVMAGYYNASAGLYRFAATELVPADAKEKAISWVLAGGIMGAVSGPWLARESKQLLTQPFAGAYLVLIGVALVALAVMSCIRFPALPQAQPGQMLGRPVRELARQPAFVAAIMSCALGYGVMNLLMAATPIAMAQCGLPFGQAATVLQWHVLAMFVPSFFTGHLIRRIGAPTVIGLGLLLNLACIAFALSGQDVDHFLWALVMLGLGWNFMFVGGTTLFTSAYAPEERARAQATMEFCINATMTVTAFSSGALVTTGGWSAMNLGSLLPLGLAAAGLLWLVQAQWRSKLRAA